MTVIQLYSVIHCEFPAPSLAQPQAAESDKPPQASCLMLLFFYACLLAAPVLTRLRSVLRHLRQIWTQSSGLRFKDYGGKKYLPPFFLKVTILGNT